ncbi:MAG: porin [Myxococcota bacterium]
MAKHTTFKIETPTAFHIHPESRPVASVSPVSEGGSATDALESRASRRNSSGIFSQLRTAALLGLLSMWGSTPVMADEPAKPAESKPEDELKKQLTTLKEDVSKLKGLKLSGFIQARAELNQSSKDGLSSDGRTAANKDQFYVRRGRLKGTYTGIQGAEVVLQIDATGRGLSLIDAEASVLSPWKQVPGKLTLGQTKVPFGYEIFQSSNERELPERSLVVNRFFPGVRDRGVKLSTSVGPVRLALGAFNGNGIEDNATTTLYQTDKNADGVIGEGEEAFATTAAFNFANVDRDKSKDFAGRVGVEFGPVTAGVSGYVGQWGVIGSLIATKNEDTGVLSYSGTGDLTYLSKTRFGADAQLNLTLLESLGASTLRAEYILGHGLFYSDKQLDVDGQGWYVTLVQGLGPIFSVAFRADQFDPDTAKEENETLTLEPAVLVALNKAAKLTVSYQLVTDFDDKDDAGNKIDKANNQLTVQLQGRF